MNIELVLSEPQVSYVREMLREYQLSLGIDLGFQNFEQELSSLPDKYAPPDGRLYLASLDGIPAGCIGIRPLQKKQCEMKRLYVRPQFRGQNIGRLLVSKVIDEARQIGYRQMLLDTLSTMTTAQALYLSLGFRELPAYCFNPIHGTKYMGLELS